MSKYKPLYTDSLLEAKRNNELDSWRESHNENTRCKKAIENTIADNFDGMHLTKDCQQGVITEFGFDRVNWVLANTLQHLKYDGRFSQSNKDWSEAFFIPRNPAHDNSLDFIVGSHPAVLDGFINNVRKQYKELNLFDFSHCEQNSRDMDFENKVLVLNPEVLRDEYKTPDDQIFYANGGFGCSPTSSGRKVYGEFLKDGEKTNYNRTDFLGVLKDKFIPEWSREKLQKMNSPTADQQQDGGMTMQ